ncbi:MAG: hypothetical protein GC199_03855 [Alphaproteobacteria bacterium]|nr:hypothetical protein [Alphaproteobacteria bacterium]
MLLLRSALIAALVLAAALGASAQQAPQDPPAQPRPVARAIDWIEARRAAAESEKTQRTAAINAFARLDQRAIDETRLPLLIPTRRPLLDRMRLMSTGDTYVLSSREDGATIEIVGTRLAATAPKGPLAEQLARRMKDMRARGYLIERTETGFDLSFSRFGAAYSMTIECAELIRDERCRREDYLRELYEGMGVVLGKAAGEQQ